LGSCEDVTEKQSDLIFGPPRTSIKSVG